MKVTYKGYRIEVTRSTARHVKLLWWEIRDPDGEVAGGGSEVTDNSVWAYVESLKGKVDRWSEREKNYKALKERSRQIQTGDARGECMSDW